MKINIIKGKIIKIIFFIKKLLINLIVLSDKIITVKPVKNVTSLNFWYLEFSFDKSINKHGIKERIGI